MAPRNFFAILLALCVGSAWAIDPLVGPGKAGAEKDEKGGIKGADAGEGPHLHWNSQQSERRVDRPEEAIEKEKKENEEKARREQAENRGQGPNSGSGASAQPKN